MRRDALAPFSTSILVYVHISTTVYTMKSPPTPPPYDITSCHERIFEQSRPPRFIRILECTSRDEYRKVYDALEAAMQKSKLLGENFVSIKNKHKLESLFPGIFADYCPEPSAVPSNRRAKALTQLAHRIKGNAVKKGKTDRTKKTRTGQHNEAAIGSTKRSSDTSDKSLRTVIGRQQLISGEDFIVVKLADGTIGTIFRVR